MAGTGKAERPKLVGATKAQSELNGTLDGFFGDLSGVLIQEPLFVLQLEQLKQSKQWHT